MEWSHNQLYLQTAIISNNLNYCEVVIYLTFQEKWLHLKNKTKNKLSAPQTATLLTALKCAKIHFSRFVSTVTQILLT